MTCNYLEIWEKYNLEPGVREHCLKVSEVAVRIAEAIKDKQSGNSFEGKKGLHTTKFDIDIDLVRIGSLLHDIGRAETHDPFEHSIKSGEILKKEGLEDEIIRIAERHFSSGITREEASRLGLELKMVLKSGANKEVEEFERDYVPVTLEEKIVSFADNIVFGNKVGKFEDYIERLNRIAENEPEKAWFVENSKKRAVEVKNEIEELTGLKF